jgi:hypothetical protein
LLLGFALLIASGAKHFVLWSQITDILDVCGRDAADYFGKNPFELFGTHNPHALRFLVMWPMVEFAMGFGLNLDSVFSWLLFFLLYVITDISVRILLLLRPTDVHSRWERTWLISIWISIALLMNGRLIIAFLGITIIMYAQISILSLRQKTGWLLILQFMGLFLCSVSSGTFAVACAVIAAFLMAAPFQRFSQHALPMSRPCIQLLGLIMTLLSAGALYKYVCKNLLFFHNSVGEMLLHGPPELLYNMGVSMSELRWIFLGIAVFIFMSMLFIQRTYSRRHPLEIPFIYLIGLSFMVGILGYSALSTMTPGVVLMVLHHAAGYIKRPKVN